MRYPKSGGISCVLLLAVISMIFGLPGCAKTQAGSLNLWPFYDQRVDPIDGRRERTILGPLIFMREGKDDKEKGIRPFYSTREDLARGLHRTDILYPISSLRRGDEERKVEVLEVMSRTRSEGRDDLTLFPFVFYRTTEEGPREMGLFPFYLNLRNRLGKDEITSYFFPFYLRTRKGDVTTRSYFFPFYSVTEGGGERGRRFWPFYGFHKKEKTGLERKFIAWPFYMRQTSGLKEKEKSSALLLLPFYASIKSPNRRYTSILFPFFGHTVVTKDPGYSQWDYPLPFLGHASGPGKQMIKIFPLYGVSVRKDTRSRFFLWPLITTKVRDNENEYLSRFKILLFLYSDVKRERRKEGTTKRRIHAWPLFSYSSDEEGMVRFQFLSILAPILGENDGIKRNWSPLWGLYRYRSNGEVSVHSLLWNFIRRERGEEFSRWEIFGPLIYNAVEEDGREFSILRGLLGFGKKDDRGYIKLFWLRIPSANKGEES